MNIRFFRTFFRIFLALTAFGNINNVFACHNTAINNVTITDNGNGTSTYDIDVTIDVGGSDGYSFGFGLIFESSAGTPVVQNGFTSSLTRATYSTLFGYTGTDIGTGPSTSYFYDRYSNRTDVLTYESDGSTSDDHGSTDYSHVFTVTVQGCVENIYLDADFRTNTTTISPNTQCYKTYSTGATCGCNCSDPTCSADLVTVTEATPYDFTACENLGTTVTNTTITNYHTLTASADGTLGILQRVQFDPACGGGAEVGTTMAGRSYELFATGDCDGTAITATVANAGYSSTLNPEWTGLTPGGTYILKISVPVGSCGVSETCLDYYHPKIVCPTNEAFNFLDWSQVVEGGPGGNPFPAVLTEYSCDDNNTYTFHQIGRAHV